MVKGHMEDGKFHPHTQYKKGVRKSRDQSEKTQGIRMKRQIQGKKFPLDSAMERMEKDFEKGLKEYNFNNPKLRNKNWDVSINYEGGFSEEFFNFEANIVGTDTVFSNRTFISNYDWSEGLEEEEQNKIETNDAFAEKEYNDWLVNTFEANSDGFFEQLLGAIEEEE